jgi:hypothetical protein
MINEKDIEDLLEKWHKTKKDISDLEAKCDKYKKLAEKILTTTGANSVSSSTYKLTRKNMSRETLAKKDVPTDVWNKYSRKVEYSAYYITEK